MPPPDPSPMDNKPDLAATMRVASMIWQSVTEVAAGVLVGWLLDLAFDTDRIFLLICGLLGIGVGMTTFIRTALRESRSQIRRAEARRNRSQAATPSDPDQGAPE